MATRTLKPSKNMDSTDATLQALRGYINKPSTRSALIDAIYDAALKGATDLKTEIDKYTTTNDAWVAYGMCMIFGCEYESATSTRKIAKVDLTKLASVISPEKLSAKISTGNVIEDLKALTLLAEAIQKNFIDPLNAMDMPLEMKTLLTVSQRGGASYDVDYRAIANAIKHNNYMLYNYGVNTMGSQYNVNKYTVEMHGGATQYFDVAQSPDDVYDSTGKLKPLGSKTLTEGLTYDFDNGLAMKTKGYVDSIIELIKGQLEALRSKGKKLSATSNTKVTTVINDMIKQHNQVIGLIETIDAQNFFPPKGVDEVKADKSSEAYKKMQDFQEAIKRKNKSDLRGVAIIDGLGAAIKDGSFAVAVADKKLR